MYGTSEGCNRSAYLNALVSATFVYLSFTIIWFLIVTSLILSSLPKNMSTSDHPRAYRRTLHRIFIVPLTRYWLSAEERNGMTSGGILQEVADSLSAILGDDKICPSDILVGLILLGKAQKIERTSSHVFEVERDDFRGSKPEIGDGHTPLHQEVSNIQHFVKYACAVYGLPLFVFANLPFGILHLVFPCLGKNHTLLQSIQLSLSREWAFGCLCCFPAAWHGRGPRHHPDIVCHSMESGVLKAPYVLAIDHEKKAIVLAIRGTMSLNDLLADLLIQEQLIKWTDDQGVDQEASTHRGMYRIAVNTIAEIRHDLLRLLVSQDSLTFGYSLVVCGHSLGGGVSAIVAFLLKQDQEFSSIKSDIYALCYACPGVVISAEGIDYFKTFCTSVIIGDDFIARISPKSAKLMYQKIQILLSQCKQRKIDILAGALLKKCLGFTRSHSTRDIDVESQGALEMDDIQGINTYLPGNVVHFIKATSPTTASDTALLGNSEVNNYELRWVDAAIFDEIIVSWTMGSTHLPNKMADVLASHVLA